ncbi:MAG: acyl-ACP--UDP-N-acetylglucosamine O-acyltransferase [bacterium]|nr:acyl-ACP--UDP-N-acetylglucosamine O-acyltransferase [bacterium]
MPKKTLIHPMALVDKKAELGKDVEIGPFSVIGPDVVIGDGTVVGNHVTVQGRTTIGKKNRIGAYTSIGMPAQDKEHWPDDCLVEIGDENDIREYVSVHRGTFKHDEPGVTRIGNKNQIMVYSHFAHDTEVGSYCMMANATTLGGHVRFGSYVVTGGLSAYHQFTRVGDYAMVGGMSACFQDVPPYCVCSGPRGHIYGINRVGLQRNGFSGEEVEQVQRLFDQYFKSGKVPSQAFKAIEAASDGSLLMTRFIEFIRNSKRGIASKG